ncbi:MAG: histidine triad nucleotide-binding protein [Planctomycetota bacterium]
MPNDCLFCKIAAGQIPSEKVYADEQVYAFRDIHPVAPTHVLIVPRKHVASLAEMAATEAAAAGRLLLTAAKIAKELGLAETGYRILTNTGPNAGQTVFHLHFHLLGGERLHPM